MPNRNVESHFSLLPQVHINRSKLDKSHRHLTSFNVGELIPLECQEVLPGDTWQVDTAKVVRMQTLLTPMMDNLYLDTYWFFVPNRLCWNHWRELMGENTESAWIPTTEYSVPQLTAPSGGWNVGTIADKLGIPTGVGNLSVNAMPFRAYALICNEWFRDQNLTDPLVVPLTDATVVGSNGSSYITDVAKGGKPFKVSKYHDYFTSCLPSPQKGPDVGISVVEPGVWPVQTGAANHALSGYGMVVKGMEKVSGQSSSHNIKYFVPTFYQNGSGDKILPPWNSSDSWSAIIGASASEINPQKYGEQIPDAETNHFGMGYEPTNLYAIPPGSVPVATINQLRQAFQVQKLYEKDARGGTRYIELLREHFGVHSPDGRLQRPEYLGGNRIPINISQVIQQSGTVSGSTPQGTVAAYSLTTDNHSDFTKSFTEHGYLFCLACVRYDHTYQQGLNRMWSRKSRFDFYWPVFANLGEQAVLNKEIYAQGSTVVDSDGKIIDDQVFGYQEAWAEYRYGVNMVTGEMRSTYAQSLDVWHLGDEYSQLPTLSDSWIREDYTTVDRVLAVTSSNADQLYGDFFFKAYATRPMPVYSVPGLIDHH